MADQARTPRERYREQTRAEAKRIALEQLAASGPAGVSVNSIARRMGVTGPALYRYFAGRDELLTELIRDAYHDLADAVEGAARESARRAPATRLREVASAFRGWALAQPHRYLLLFGTPVPGYVAPPDTVNAAHRSMAAILDVLAALAPPELAARPRRSALDRQLGAWGERQGAGHLPAAVLRRGLAVWSRLHGMVSLEIAGHLTPMGVDGELLFRAELDALLAEPW
ncbi:transcriptional regulator, TetR family [Streptoalloteichus tenebrarius]|uniref:Transcriptional regulator, TetR family n=1 Tax=Streptoalloteichus tenebrarius (strain ATCC 17920 / DSM 40477 / JCM 4838 / CBS 697.72 / NBRC 16177 / NCIMB 11028 / NRRL B-12390 / A12253. 1 / ISP 5477) TaxID=1933 RepID=A0ABT1I1A4_STRSD|nr:TetR/AcrR family transcriptional regulator [Streptoalloteichus tenebrarius]MCP2261544.1 transcriptional regulator, TetR family [Streptoalloteichus tenebrarius]BFF02681.1 TetR/AcrR family transcriptional regulator [Streptoalloteichus tenebrarius]